MAKRFTDTQKWSKGSFQNLSPKMKLVWLYLCDSCDHAGVWDINLPLLIFQTGYKITIEELEKNLSKWIVISGDKIIIESFISFQYGDLNPGNKVHLSVLKRLEKLAPTKGLASPCQGAKDKDKEKEKEEYNLDNIYQEYPVRVGGTNKPLGMKRLTKIIKNKQDFDLVLKAVMNYKKNCDALNKTGTEFVKQFSGFFGPEYDWKQWIAPEQSKQQTIEIGDDFLK